MKSYKRGITYMETIYAQIFLSNYCLGDICTFAQSSNVSQNNTNNTSMPAAFNGTTSVSCPTSSDPETFSACCVEREWFHSSSNVVPTVCCLPNSDVNDNNDRIGIKIGIAFTAIISVILVTVLLLVLYKHTKCCKKTFFKNYQPKFRVTLNRHRHSVGPADKKTLLKTANYTVEKNWEQAVIKFHYSAFFNQFKLLLVSRYKELTWDSKQPTMETVKSSEGEPVNLRIIEESMFLIVTNTGNINWVMNDFQNICKNVHVQDPNESRGFSNLPVRHNHPLLPRMATIDEQHFQADDYTVKITQTEIDIKFHSSHKFYHFKRALLLKYPTVPWSKYLQRDCAQIKIENGKRVTVHLWEEICSIWLSGDGRMDWYQNEFEVLVQESYQARFLASFNIRPLSGRSKLSDSLVTQASLSSTNSSKSYKDVVTVYTVKTLDTGGYEMEFPNNDFLQLFKSFLKLKYPSSIWKEYSCRHIAKITLDKSRSVSIHISTETSGQRKIWIYDESEQDWINTTFREIYESLYRHLYEPQEEDVPKSDNALTEVESTI